jgi:hypothetical protein
MAPTFRDFLVVGPTAGRAKPTGNTDRFLNSDFWTEDNQENEERNVHWKLVFVTFVSFCKSQK